MAGKKSMDSLVAGMIGQPRRPAAVVTQAKEKIRKVGRPKVKPDPATPAEAGCKIGEMRVTTILDKTLMEQVRRLAYWDRRNVKTIISMALEQYVESYEKKHGKLQAIPERE